MTIAAEDKKFLQAALDTAQKSVAHGGFPAGSIVVKDAQIIGRGVSIGASLNDPTSHSDIAAIRDACAALKTTSLANCVLYSSLEPCLMCLGAGIWSDIPKIVFACAKDKVSPLYYGAHYHADPIKPIAMIHAAEFESASLKIIADWETRL